MNPVPAQHWQSYYGSPMNLQGMQWRGTPIERLVCGMCGKGYVYTLHLEDASQAIHSLSGATSYVPTQVVRAYGTCSVCGTVSDLDGWREAKPQPPPEHLLLASPIEAWRAWRISRPESLTFTRERIGMMREAYRQGIDPFEELLGARLQPVGLDSGLTWERVQEASCERHKIGRGMGMYGGGGPHGESAPERWCECGIWALQEESAVLAVMREHYVNKLGELWAWGKVELWGRFFEHRKGFRAQYARPKEIWITQANEGVADELTSYYGCAVHFKTNPHAELLTPDRAQLMPSGSGGTVYFAPQISSYVTAMNQMAQTFSQASFALNQIAGPTHGTPSTFLECSKRWTEERKRSGYERAMEAKRSRAASLNPFKLGDLRKRARKA